MTIFARCVATEMRSIALLVLLVCASLAYADGPLPPPSTHEIFSPDKRYSAISDPKTGTIVFDSSPRRPRWSIPGWYRWLYLSNDGEHLVAVYDGMNLIPLDHDNDLTLLTFWENGKIIRAVTLREVVPDRTLLPRTASHYYWGTVNGINNMNELVIERQDGQRFRFSMSTGMTQ